MADNHRRRAAWVVKMSRSVSIWSFTAALVTSTALCWVLVAHDLRPVTAPLRLPWPLLAAGFAIGHLACIRVEFRKSNHTMDLTDVVLLPAIVFAGAGVVVSAAAIGTALSSAWDRQPPIKAAFNTSLHALSAAVALLCFHAAIGGASVLSAQGWFAAVAAVLAAEMVTFVGIQLVIALASGSFSLEGPDQLSVTIVSTVAIDTVLGLTAVHLLWSGLGGGLLFVAVAAAVAVEYANHGRLRIRHTTLNQLYHFEKALAGIVEFEMVISAVLNEALKLFNAEVAQLVLPGPEGTVCHTLRAGQSHPVTSEGSHPLAELLEGASGVLLAPRGLNDPRSAEALVACGFRDAIALRLPADVAAAVEVLVVADRLGGDHVTFDAADVTLAETLATPTAMALRSSDLLNQLRAQVSLKEHQASHDALTGLANRTLFSSEVDRALAERPDDALVGIMLIDLDGFKGLNDTLGHEAGDSFLQSAASGLDATVGGRGTVGRLGGDEFAVVIPHARHPAEITAIAGEIDAAVRAPLAVADTTVQLRASIGVTVAPLHGDDRFTLLRQADLAMYRAKQHGGGVAVHNDRQDDHIDRPSLIAALREAIHTSSLRLSYQPKVRCSTAEVAGVEALLRWTHPRYGSIAPDQFIPVAERSGLIRPLTRWVLSTAIAQCSTWHRAGVALNVAVNLSPTQLNDQEIVDQIRLLLETYELPADALTLEITESAALAGQAGDDQHVLGSLARLGVRLSVDDFGVGTSSLARVKRLPVNEVKIDKSFITNLTSESVDDAIVASTINLAHQLGLEVVAEGVEDEATYQQLRTLGCDIVQGFLISAPLLASELLCWIRTRDRVKPEHRTMGSTPCLEPLTNAPQ